MPNLTNGEERDIEAIIYIGLQVFQIKFLNEVYKGESSWTYIQSMEYARRMDMLPNVLVAYKTMLTIPITNISVEKKFFKVEALEIVYPKYLE